MQRDFLPGGALAVSGGDQIIPGINRIAAKFDHVILTQDWHPLGHISFASSHPGKQPFADTVQAPYGTQHLWPDHCVQGTPGAELDPRLQIPHAELVLRKGFPPQHRQLLRLPRRRPHHPHRPRRLPPRAQRSPASSSAASPTTSASASPPSTAPASALPASSSKTSPAPWICLPAAGAPAPSKKPTPASPNPASSASARMHSPHEPAAAFA